MKKTRNILLLILSICILVCISLFTFGVYAYANSNVISGDGIKTRQMQVAPQNANYSDSRKGLRLYAYDNGSTAKLNGLFSGVFEIDLKASSENQDKPNLSSYSIKFQSVNSDSAFSIVVEDSGTEFMACVDVNGNKAGVYYNVDDEWDGKAHGYTSLKNDNGEYTRIVTTSSTCLKFNPTTMVVSAENISGDDVVIWDFSQREIDGKLFDCDLDFNGPYSVSIEFTQVKAGERGDLTIYRVNDTEYDTLNVNTNSVTVYTTVEENAIVGKQYKLPIPTVYDSNDNVEAEDIRYIVYDDSLTQKGNGSFNGDAVFVPEEQGNYYLYYYYEENSKVVCDAYYKVLAINENDINYTFSGSQIDNQTIGLNSIIVFDEVYFESNLLKTSNSIANVVVEKNGVVIKEFLSGCEYQFTEIGNYDVYYKYSLGDKTFITDKVQVDVSSSVAGIVYESLKETYNYNDVIQAPKVTVYINNQQGEATSYFVLPNGDISNKNTLTLNQVGKYVIKYEYNVGGVSSSFEKSFDVYYEVTDLFTVGEKTKVYYDESVGNTELAGVTVEMNANTSYITYDVDLSDNTKLDNLIELYALPNSIGVKDMDGFYITLTDKLNRDNYITLRAYSGDGNMVNGTYLKGKACNQPAYTGWYKNRDWDAGEPYPWTESIENATAHNSGGFVSGHNFYCNTLSKDLSKLTIKLMYDTSEKAFYSEPDVAYKHAEGYREWLIVDFDDSNEFINLWTGFTDNSQVELKITPIGVSGTARLKILSIDGTKFNSNVVVDNTAPIVNIDYVGNTTVPNAMVGLPYKIFDIVCQDNICSADSLKTEIVVTHNGENIAVSDGYFTPSEVGEYKITYTVADGYDNKTIKEVIVNAKNNISSVTAYLDGEFDENIIYGAKIKLPSFYGEGGSGKYEYLEFVEVNGEKIDILNGSITPLEEGNYKFTLRVCDYLGQYDEITKEYTIAFESTIILDEEKISLPYGFISGTKYVFENYSAIIYESIGSEPIVVYPTIYVDDANGENVEIGTDRVYVPKCLDGGSNATIRFVFKHNSITKTIEKVVPISSATKGTKGFLAGYFSGENVDINATSSNISFCAKEQDDVVIKYARAVQCENFRIQLTPYVDTDSNVLSNYSTLKIILTDKNDCNVKVVLEIINESSNLFLRINGGEKVYMPGTLREVSTQKILLAYDNSTFSLTGTEGVTLGTVSTTFDGDVFTGFTSSEVYLQFELNGVYGEAGICLVAINNQMFTNTKNDTVAPEIFVKGSYSGRFVQGETIIIPKACVYDVVGYVDKYTTITVSKDGVCVVAKDGTLLDNATADKEYEICLTELGRYTVTYSAKDDANRYKEASKSIVIYSTEIPSIELTSSISETVNVGTVYTLPTYKLISSCDSSLCSVEVFYTDPYGITQTAKDNKIEVKQSGMYTIYYYIIDANGNYNVVSYSFVAVR